MESEALAEWIERLDDRRTVVVEDDGVVVTRADDGDASPGDD